MALTTAQKSALQYLIQENNGSIQYLQYVGASDANAKSELKTKGAALLDKYLKATTSQAASGVLPDANIAKAIGILTAGVKGL